jgi:hypothetical protein
MRRVIEPEKLWHTGCGLVRLGAGVRAADAMMLPPEMPFPFEALVAAEADPRHLVAALAAALPKLG